MTLQPADATCRPGTDWLFQKFTLSSVILSRSLASRGRRTLDYVALPQQRFWRVAWEGDLKPQLIALLGFDPLDPGGFIWR